MTNRNAPILFVALLIVVILLGGQGRAYAQSRHGGISYGHSPYARSVSQKDETIIAEVQYNGGPTDSFEWAYSGGRTTYLPVLPGAVGLADTVWGYYGLGFGTDLARGISTYNSNNQTTSQLKQDNMGADWFNVARFVYSNYYNGTNMPLTDSIETWRNGAWQDSAVIVSFITPLGPGDTLSGYDEYFDSSGVWSLQRRYSKRQTGNIVYDTTIQYVTVPNGFAADIIYTITTYDGQGRQTGSIGLSGSGTSGVITAFDTSETHYSAINFNGDGTSYDTAFATVINWDEGVYEGTDSLLWVDKYDQYGNITSDAAFMINHGYPEPNGVVNWYYKLNANASNGVDVVKNEDALLVYPNPASDLLNIKNSLGCGETLLKLYDLQGRTLISTNYVAWAGENEVLDLSNISNGVYILQLTSPTGVASKQVIVAR